MDDLIASVAQPQRLAGFCKTELEPGSSTTVELELAATVFEILDRNMQSRIEPGDFMITVYAGDQRESLTIRANDGGQQPA